MTLPPLSGIVPPLASPLKSDGSLDPDGLTRLVEFQIGAGVHGLWINGTTARFDLLSDSDRRLAAETAASAAGGRVPMVLNVSDLGTRRTQERARACDDLPYDFYAALPPWYLPMAAEEVSDYFLALADTVSRPLFIYNAPWINNQLSFAALRRLAEHPRIVGCKDVGPSLTRTLEWPAEERRRLGFSYLHGNDLLATSVDMGADGFVTSLSNAFPELAVALWDAARSCDAARSFRLQSQLTRLSRILDFAPGLGGLEAACRHRGLLGRMLPHPLRSLAPDAASRVAALLDDVGVRPCC